ncbi:MAG: histidine kinase dimerization/phospho-acceptor domain-containing protein [Acidobacteriaceae bacterium]
MPETEEFGGGSNRRQMKQLSAELHELCQPLTTLQCTLEMAALTDTHEAYREAMETGLAECRRMVALVESMREILHEAVREAEAETFEADQ